MEQVALMPLIVLFYALYSVAKMFLRFMIILFIAILFMLVAFAITELYERKKHKRKQ